MKKNSINWFILCFMSIIFTSPIIAQEVPFSGLLFDDTAYNTSLVVPRYTGIKFNDLPKSVSLKAYCPTPKDQGDISSCVGWATGYAALTTSRAIQANIKSPALIKQMANSALFIYNQINIDKSHCNSGAKITDALSFLKAKGNCLYRDFDHFATCTETPSTILQKNALRYQIQDYQALFQLTDPSGLKVLKTKQALADNKPVIVGIRITTDFWDIKNRDTIWQPSIGNILEGHGHALVVVGYDDINKRFELMNSSGKDWGNGGFIWISYSDYAKVVKYGFQINLKPKEKERLKLKGSLLFRYPYAYQEDTAGYRLNDDEGCPMYLYKTIGVQLDAATSFYKLSNRKSKVGTTMQLVASNIPSGKYLYVFSVSPNNKIQTHWPRENFSNLTNNKAAIIIPGKCLALSISEVGKQYLYAIISHEKIQASTIRNEKLMKKKIENLLPNRTAIKYEKDRIAGVVNENNIDNNLIFVIEVDAYE